MQSKSMEWGLYERKLRRERVKALLWSLLIIRDVTFSQKN